MTTPLLFARSNLSRFAPYHSFLAISRRAACGVVIHKNLEGSRTAPKDHNQCVKCRVAMGSYKHKHTRNRRPGL